jgi:hypothetical protein
VPSRPDQLSVPEPGELQRLLAAIHWQQQSPGVNPQEMLHDLQRLIDSRSWEGAVDDDGRPMNFRRALEEDWPTGVGLTQSRRERLFALAEGYRECKDMLADVKRRIDELLPLAERQAGPGRGHKRDRDPTPFSRGADYDRRRLARDCPDIYERVLADEISLNAGMIEAGLRRRTFKVPADDVHGAVAALLRRFERDDLQEALDRAPDPGAGDA